MGFANFFKKIINNYSALTNPLTSLTHKATKFAWSLEVEEAFRALQQAFTTTPILQHFQPTQPLTIEADASDFALDCILSQPASNEDLHLVCFYSRKFTLAELNYPIYDKELMAVVAAFKL